MLKNRILKKKLYLKCESFLKKQNPKPLSWLFQMQANSWFHTCTGGGGKKLKYYLKQLRFVVSVYVRKRPINYNKKKKCTL